MPITVKRPTSRKHSSIIQANIRQRNIELQNAVRFCQENNVRGYAAIAAGICPSIKDGRTINNRLDGSPKKMHRFHNQKHTRYILTTTTCYIASP